MSNHTLIYDGYELFGFGSNDGGELGLGDNIKNRNVPTLMMTDKTMKLFVEYIIHLYLKNQVNCLFLVIIIMVN